MQTVEINTDDSPRGTSARSKRLLELAKAGDVAAARLLFGYAIGSPWKRSIRTRFRPF